MVHNEKTCLSILGFGFASGMMWGLGMLILGLCAWQFNWGWRLVDVMGSLYWGFSPTLIGSLWGGLWGFVDGLIAGIVLALFYNCWVKCCGSKSGCWSGSGSKKK